MISKWSFYCLSGSGMGLKRRSPEKEALGSPWKACFEAWVAGRSGAEQGRELKDQVGICLSLINDCKFLRGALSSSGNELRNEFRFEKPGPGCLNDQVDAIADQVTSEFRGSTEDVFAVEIPREPGIVVSSSQSLAAGE